MKKKIEQKEECYYPNCKNTVECNYIFYNGHFMLCEKHYKLIFFIKKISQILKDDKII